MENVSGPRPLVVDTSTIEAGGLNVAESISRFRQEVRGHLKRAYSTVPTGKINLDIKAYVNKYPQSAIVVMKQDANLFPVVIDEAKTFANNHGGARWLQTSKWLTFLREHEGEHLGEALAAGHNVGGIGLVMYKNKRGITFGGFVGLHDEGMKSDEKLSFLLAPTIPGAGDLSDAFQLIIGSKTKDELHANLQIIDDIIGNRSPVNIVNFVKKVLKS